MNFLHWFYHIGPDDLIVVTLDKQANVRLLDDSNYAAYRCGRRHTCHGGCATVSPVRLSPPSYGRWHLAVDLGGGRGTVSASASVVGRSCA